VLPLCAAFAAQVRYLIDYYNAKPSAGKPVAMYLDVRPAGDDAQGVWERVRMPFMRLWRAGRSVD
jgi:cytochrome c heme-lyase